MYRPWMFTTRECLCDRFTTLQSVAIPCIPQLAVFHSRLHLLPSLQQQQPVMNLSCNFINVFTWNPVNVYSKRLREYGSQRQNVDCIQSDQWHLIGNGICYNVVVLARNYFVIAASSRTVWVIFMGIARCIRLFRYQPIVRLNSNSFLLQNFV